MDGPHLKALEDALQAMGNSKPRLAEALSIQMDDLESYFAGREIPWQIFLAALKIITGR